MPVELEVHVPVLAVSPFDDAHGFSPMQLFYAGTIDYLLEEDNANSALLFVADHMDLWGAIPKSEKGTIKCGNLVSAANVVPELD